MTYAPESVHPEKVEHSGDQNGWKDKDKSEMSNGNVIEDACKPNLDGDKNSYVENDDQEENLPDGSPHDICLTSERSLSTVVRVQENGSDNAIYHSEDGMEVNISEIEGTPGVDNVGLAPFRNRREQSCSSRRLEEALALYEQELLEDDDEDDKDWLPFRRFAVQTKWFCTNCTMANFDDSVYCDLCGEHRNFELIPAKMLGKFEASRERLEESKNDAVTLPSPTPSMLEESSTSSFHKRTAIGFDERMMLHSEIKMKSHPHPERPDRLQAIIASLTASGFFPGKCFPIPAREATYQELAMVHTSEHVDAVELTSCNISSYFTPDTYANRHSALAARLAAGICADLATAIMTGQAQNGFALVRPPGHHAGVKDSMGFCLHNNAAVAVMASRAAGAKKVLIVDWDVHHGNGTQEIFDSDKSVLYISLHRHEGGHFYPGSGAASEVGTFGGEGYSVNIPWKCGGVGDNDYNFAFQHAVLPIAYQFASDITIISAGFDAAKGDPLGCCEVTPAGFANMTQMLSGLSNGKMLVILEGGYNLQSISSSATAVVKVLLGDNPDPPPQDTQPSKSGLKTLLEVLEIQSKYWSSVREHYLQLQLHWQALYGRKKTTAANKLKTTVAQSTTNESTQNSHGQQQSKIKHEHYNTKKP
ncbi:histone deacetylase 15 isoform X2 [Cryptomeria japonica]|uniref:histone deacetylase 15 isoform X2 n=1 Tax=Cryptomeria japonica TaxID=3369 RepID=UPI0025ACC7CB|nr:histone deacetylase 15 isoform X2 [Cryptomeria japonica]